MQLLSLLYYLGMIYGVGASTFALLFYFRARKDGKVDASEHNLIHVVNFILRIGVFVLALIEFILIVTAWKAGYTEYFFSSVLWIRLGLLFFLTLDAAILERKLFPGWVGPGLAAGLWYLYFFIHLFKPAVYSFATLLSICVVSIVAWLYVVRTIKKIYLKK